MDMWIADSRSVGRSSGGGWVQQTAHPKGSFFLGGGGVYILVA